MTSMHKGSRIRRVASTVLAAVAIGATLVGCSGAAAPSGSGDDLDAALKTGGEITYWSWTPSAEAQVAAFEKAYPNVIYFNEVDKGGHFAAWEEPELFASEVRAAFRSLR
jgi:ABC-type glycerol-3-phosphate transport system substrate-binding protein